MGVLDRLTGGDEEERSPEVRALHDAMVRAGTPTPATNAALLNLLAHTHLWAMTVGPAPSPAQMDAQAKLSGSVSVRYRAGRTQAGESYLATATTRKRLLVAVQPQPGDELVRAGFRFLAVVARYGGLPIYINAGTVPMGFISGPALYSFADGMVPDPADPLKAAMPRSQNSVLETIDEESIPGPVLDAIRATQRESSIRAASLVLMSKGGGKVYMILAVIAGNVDRDALTQRVARQLVDLIGRDNYFAMEFVAQNDLRLTDPDRAVVLVRE